MSQILIAVLVASLTVISAAAEEMRLWSDINGRTLHGVFEGLTNDDTCVVISSQDKKYLIKVKSLGPEEIEYLNAMRARNNREFIERSVEAMRRECSDGIAATSTNIYKVSGTVSQVLEDGVVINGLVIMLAALERLECEVAIAKEVEDFVGSMPEDSPETPADKRALLSWAEDIRSKAISTASKDEQRRLVFIKGVEGLVDDDKWEGTVNMYGVKQYDAIGGVKSTVRAYTPEFK